MPTEEEVSDRLARLKGVETGAAAAAGGYYHKPDTRPQARQSDDLLSQMQEEVKLDGVAGQVEKEALAELEARLAKLKGFDPPSKAAQGQGQGHRHENEEEMNSDDEAEKIMSQVMAERDLEEDLEEPPPLSQGMTKLVRQLTRDLQKADDEDEEELPWCGICNEDAALKCLDCEGDLFCRRCFDECHDEFDMKHRSQVYQAKANKK